MVIFFVLLKLDVSELMPIYAPFFFLLIRARDPLLMLGHLMKVLKKENGE